MRLLHFGRGNTAGDVLVEVPDAKVLATGDVVVAPTPYAHGSYIHEWRAVLRKVRERGATILVPGHGPIERDYAYVDALSALLASVDEQVARLAKGGASLEDVRKRVDLADFRTKLAGSDAGLRTDFELGFVRPAVERAYQEATGALTDE